jgi:diguanylate cyclase (GGDEF)-like protein
MTENLGLTDRIDAYADWVRTLRAGHAPPALPTDGADPLARLGHELQLLSTTLSRRDAELRGLFSLVQSVERGVLLDDVLSKIFVAFKGVIPFDRIGCAFLSDDGSDLVAYWARTELGEVKLQSGYSRPMLGSSLEGVLATRQPRIINDLEAYLQAKPGSDATRRIVAEGGRSSLTCPLIIDDRALGFLFFTSREKGIYDETHQLLFLQITHQVALVIEKSRLYERLVAHNRSLVERTQRLQQLADQDGLTGALTRRALDAVLDRVWTAYRGGGTPFGVILLDVDHFKAINDRRGHAAGDAVLQEVVGRIIRELRRCDVCGRYGGEEFLVVVPDTTEAHLLEIAERLRLTIAGTHMGPSGDVAVTASFGVAHTCQRPSSWAALEQMADRALYQAKADGRNRCVLAGDQRS